jgi:hypothetical protein
MRFVHRFHQTIKTRNISDILDSIVKPAYRLDKCCRLLRVG